MNPDFEPTTAPPAQPARRALRSWFWPGFAAGFLLLSVLSCGGLAMATGLNRIDLEDIQGSGAVWTPPEVTPTATLDPNAAQAAPAPGGGLFQPGETVRNVTNSRVNLRQSPGHLGKTQADILGQLQSLLGQPRWII
jgi:hypothetical protein